TLLRQFAAKDKNFCYLNFDDERLINFDVSDFSMLMLLWQKQGDFKTIYLDEVQNVPQWERFVRRIRDEGYKVFITGSNSKLLSSELGTHLTGRYRQIELYPFSFNEYLQLCKLSTKNITTTTKQAKILHAFDTYLLHGGFPYYCKTKERSFLSMLYDNIIYKDVLFRFAIREKKAFRELANYAMTNIAKEFSYENLAKTLQFKSSTTVKDYLLNMEDTYLFYMLPKYDFSLKKQHVSNKKLYTIDNGLRNTVAFSFSEDSGRLLENAVFIDLKRRNSGSELYFHRDKRECDFIVRDGASIVQAVQVCDQLTPENRQREIEGLLEALERYKLPRGTLVTKDTELTEKHGNKYIDIIPAWKWFLNNSSL
ncbi:MAG: ATP-binding protein, partial [Prevotellaceae bacterium]|nr:ATP-binding protein [Prevotellaceae bacterium]